MNKGYFITLEGPDGSGKSTQLELIAEYLRQNGREVVCTREPGGSEAAERLRQLVLDPQLAIDARTETLLYLAARADHLDKVVRPALAQRGVTDRFENEGLAFQLKVRQGFVELSKAYPQRIRVIDALQEQESVRGCLISELEALLKG